MLEDPSYAEIVRWGDEGDSFVVLEVMSALRCGNTLIATVGLTMVSLYLVVVREIYQNHPAKTF